MYVTVHPLAERVISLWSEVFYYAQVSPLGYNHAGATSQRTRSFRTLGIVGMFECAIFRQFFLIMSVNRKPSARSAIGCRATNEIYSLGYQTDFSVKWFLAINNGPCANPT